MPTASASRPTKTQLRRPLWTTILRLLGERPSHGYELVARLGDETVQPAAGLNTTPAPDAVSVYRALRAMEAEGLVSSTWDVSQVGPARRVYVPTPAVDRTAGDWAAGDRAV
jgi:DNA-binding PadR family transcriptional regulator